MMGYRSVWCGSGLGLSCASQLLHHRLIVEAAGQKANTNSERGLPAQSSNLSRPTPPAANMPPSGACCSHDHDCEAADCGPSYSLYKHIDQLHMRCLNEDVEGSCKNVLKAWAVRTQPTENPLRSDPDDPELLLHIPFDGAVKLKAICVIGGGEGTAPSRMRAFINRDDLDFASIANMTPTQEWDLQEVNSNGVLEYPTQVAKFSGIHSVDLHFPTTFGSDQCEIHFIGLKGEFSERQRRAVEAVYEARPVPGDHKVPDMHGARYDVS